MKTSNKVTLAVGILGAIATISAGAIGSKTASNRILTEMQNSIGQISGNNNTVNMNSVDGLVKNFEQLKTSNDRYARQLEEANEELKELKGQIGDIPIL